MNKLFCLGYGYVAQRLSPILLAEGWQLGGTTRDEAKASAMQAAGIEVAVLSAIPADTTHLLISIPASEGIISALPDLPNLQWVGYLSATSTYGDHGGDWVDESTPSAPVDARGEARVQAEQDWLAYHPSTEIFRLSGIYGPGRSALDQLYRGTARRIDKPGQYFSRVHVADIVLMLQAALKAPEPQSITNVADNLPAPSHEVVAYAAKLLGIEPPALIPFEQAELSDMARSFYAANKRIRNERMKQRIQAALASDLHYPDYKQGLQAILAARP